MELKEIGITEKKERQFNKKSIYKVEDFFLAEQIPRKYLDCTKITGLHDKEHCCVSAIVKNTKQMYGSTPYVMAACEVIPTKEKLTVFWFNQNYLYNTKIRFTTGKNVYIAGKVQYEEKYDSYTIANPDIFEEDSWETRIVKPIYKKTAGMSEDYFIEKLTLAWQTCSNNIPEIMPKSSEKELPCSMRSCMRYLHFPSTIEETEKGTERLIFNDLVRLSLCEEVTERSIPLGSPFRIKSLKLYNQAMKTLPFTPTKDQMSCIEDHIKLAMDGRYIHSMITGDVGSGKTFIAQAIISVFVGSNFQTAVMAPTQILARQHYASFKEFFEPLGITPVLLDSTLKAKERREILRKIKTGEALIIIGTHSLIGKDVEYKDLALVVVDEQHRFGIAQREALTNKGKAGCSIIHLSATPIPQSLASSIYGSALNIYQINTMPEGRLPVITGIAKSREKIYKFIHTQVKEKNRQIFIVCPAIEDVPDEEHPKASVKKIFEEYSNALPDIKMATLTGKDSKEKTEETMSAFEKNEISVLISTTVIEVGVNIKNAVGLIVENPEYFGLAQLHQLRGRVGRNSIQSYCVLETDFTTEDNPRLAAICKSNSGFELAQMDLEERGPGSLLGGTNQSGKNKYILLAMKYPEIYKKAKEFAKKYFDTDEEFKLRDEILSEGYEM